MLIVTVIVAALLLWGIQTGDIWEWGHPFFPLELFITLWILFTILIPFSWFEVEITILGDDLEVVVREGLGKWSKERAYVAPRDRIARIIERGFLYLMLAVVVEDEKGRRLAIFPKFLLTDEHKRMIATILEWGNQPSGASPEASGPR